MLPSFMPQFIANFIAKLSYCIFNFDFLYDYVSLNLINVQFSFSYSQPSFYIDLMNITSGSTLVNIQGNLMTLLHILILHCIVMIMHYFIRHKQSLPWYLRWIRNLKEFMTFGVYIQFVTSSCLLVCLISSTEIMRFDHSEVIYTISLCFAFVVMMMLLVYFLFVVCKWHEYRDNSKFIHIKYTKQLFDSIRETKEARTFIIKYLFQRIIFCLIAVLWTSTNTYSKLSVYSCFQLVFFIYTLLLRPFNNVKDNLLEIVNEVHYAVLTFLLLFMNNESDWSQTMEIAYIAIIISNSIIVCLISLTFLLKSLCSWITTGNVIPLRFSYIKEIASQLKNNICPETSNFKDTSNEIRKRWNFC